MTVYKVTGIGNAMVDVLANCDEQFLIDNNIEKGAMTLIDEDRAKELFSKMGECSYVSGGSVANSMAGIASFGAKCAYIGLVANDQLGEVFGHDIAALGITYNTPRFIQGKETGRCYIFITPDGERSMNTFLGACTELSVEHVDEVLIANSAVTYMEGYLFDKDPAKEAYYRAAEIAHEAGREIALSLSDSFCVQRHQSDFQKLVNGNVDILFGNEKELCSLYDLDDVDAATEKAAEHCKVVVSTRGAEGVVIMMNGEKTIVPADAVEQVVDSTGAGDQLAAGFLYGYTNDMSMEECGILGVKAAAEVISHIGPRPQIEYKDFLAA